MDNTDTRVHVCFVNVTKGIGGVERVIERHSENLNPSRYRISYAYTPFPNDAAHIARLRAAGVGVVPMDNVLPLWAGDPGRAAGPAKKSITRFWKTLVPVRVDELVYHFRNVRRLTRVFETALARIDGTPKIFQQFAGDYFWMAAAFHVLRRLYPEAILKLHLGNPPVFLNPTFIERRAFREADSVTFVSRHTKTAWEKALGFTVPHGRLIRTPVTTDVIPFIERAKTPGKEPFILLSVGRLSPIKGIDIALQALRQIRDSGFDAALWIVGTGPEESRLRQLTQELGLTDHVKFHGFVNDPSSLFAEVDFLLQPSTLTEGVPNSMLEAMASGMPVIASRVGGIPEVITDKETGILVDPSDPRQIADAVVTLIRDIELRKRISRTASEYVRKYYSAKAVTASLARLYESLLADNPALATQTC